MKFLDTNLLTNQKTKEKKKNYLITFITNCSHYSFVDIMKNKNEEFDMFKILVSGIENQFNGKIKRFCSDIFLNKFLVTYLTHFKMESLQK
jgi:hypothetical protein